MTITQQLFLKLSTGLVPSPQIVAVHLDTFHQRCDGEAPKAAVAVWLKGRGDDPCYFLHGTLDAEVVVAWSMTQPGEQFLALPGRVYSTTMTHLFACDAIEFAEIDKKDKSVRVKLKNDARFWWFSPRSWAAEVVRLWQGDITDARVAVTSLAS